MAVMMKALTIHALQQESEQRRSLPDGFNPAFRALSAPAFVRFPILKCVAIPGSAMTTDPERRDEICYRRVP